MDAWFEDFYTGYTNYKVKSVRYSRIKIYVSNCDI